MFSRGFRLIPFSDEECWFPSVSKCLQSAVVLGPILRSGNPCFVGVDISGKKRPGNTIVAVSMCPATKERVVVKSLRGAWSSVELATKIGEVDRELNPRVIVVENNGVQQTLIDWMQALKLPGWVKIVPFTTTGQKKFDPETGVKSLEIEFSNGAWVLPYGEFGSHMPGCECGWCVLYRELRDWPMGTSTDSAMALWFARQGIQLYGAEPGDMTVEGLGDR